MMQKADDYFLEFGELPVRTKVSDLSPKVLSIDSNRGKSVWCKSRIPFVAASSFAEVVNAPLVTTAP